MRKVKIAYITSLFFVAFLTNADSRVSFPFKSSLGQICKTADFVAKGILINIEEEGIIPHKVITFKINEVVLGDSANNSDTYFKAIIDSGYDLNINEKYLIFASQKYFPVIEGSIVNYDQYRFDFRREDSGVKLNTMLNHDWFIIGGSRGIFPLGPKEEIDNLLEVVKGYWGHLRGSERNREKFETFLTGLLNSDNLRVKSDAHHDLRTLIRLSDSADLKRMAGDEALPDDLRTYATERLNRKND